MSDHTLTLEEARVAAGRLAAEGDPPPGATRTSVVVFRIGDAWHCRVTHHLEIGQVHRA